MKTPKVKDENIEALKIAKAQYVEAEQTIAAAKIRKQEAWEFIVSLTGADTSYEKKQKFVDKDGNIYSVTGKVNRTIDENALDFFMRGEVVGGDYDQEIIERFSRVFPGKHTLSQKEWNLLTPEQRTHLVLANVVKESVGTPSVEFK